MYSAAPYVLALTKLCCGDEQLAGSDLAFLQCTYNKIPIFDTSKARKELGMEFFSVKKTMLDMTAALVKQGVVRLPPAAPKKA